MKEIKFRCFYRGKMYNVKELYCDGHEPMSVNAIVMNLDGLGLRTVSPDSEHVKAIMQYTGLNDKNGKEIYEGDILEFADKWEWYRTSYGIKMRFAEPKRKAELQKQYDAEPMERRVIEMPGCYEWILSSEIQTYWHVIGNIYQNPELVSSSEIPTRETK